MIHFRLWHNGDVQSGGHRDMHIELNEIGLKQTFDSYFILDNKNFPIHNNHLQNDLANIRKTIQYLLDLLKEKLDKKLPTLYFPIVLFDEYSAALRFTPKPDDCIEVVFGWTRIHGYTVDLSRPELYVVGPDEFNVTHGPQIVQRMDFLNGIDAAIDHMKNVPYKEPSVQVRNYPGVTFLYPKPGEEE